MPARNRYAMLTVDTEALPRRARDDHVNRLIWGRHELGSAGIREMCDIGDEFGAKHIFFVDICGALTRIDEVRATVTWLSGREQDVQLHAHPEVLPAEFWSEHGFADRPLLMNEYTDEGRSRLILRYFGEIVAEASGKKIQAFRAGSFRWNTGVLRSMAQQGLRLSFNNSMRAYQAGRCPHGEQTNYPYAWSNGIIEVPVTERFVPGEPGGNGFWASLTYPESPYFPYIKERVSWWNGIRGFPGISVFLLHSWSFLYWNAEGHAVYRDDARLEGYRRLVARVAKDYDIITTDDFLDLLACGKIRLRKTVDIEKAAYVK